MRASGKDEAVVLSPPIRFSLEQAMEFIDDDELIEVTPNFIRLRKRYLLENQRKRGGRESMDQAS
jgi:GTP-binding protein